MLMVEHELDRVEALCDSVVVMAQGGVIYRGAMVDARWKDFHSIMVEAGLYTADLDLKRAYTLQFVNKKHGMGLKKS